MPLQFWEGLAVFQCCRSSEVLNLNNSLNILISLSKFNLFLIGSFYVTHAARAVQNHDLSGRELNCGSQTYFVGHTRTWRASPDEWSARCLGHLRDSTNMKKNTPSTHSFIPTRRIWNDDDGRQMTFGDLVGLTFPDICLTSEENPGKNLTQETCLDRGSNPGPLQDKRARYHFLHSGGLVKY